MDIPYTVTPRKDTGLINSKLGIWLFLASEVMLFGGLFSGYVFLRIYADYPWPERALPVLPGLINTFVLIGSSVTVVFAWASLKMRQWRRFQIFMGITIACAGIFMVLKGLEYNAKWHHQAVRLNDFTILEGHTHKATLSDEGLVAHHDEGHGEEGDHADGADDKEDGHEDEGAHGGETASHDDKDGHGDGEDKKAAHADDGQEPFPANVVAVSATELNFTLVRAHAPYIDDILEKASARDATPKLSKDVFCYGTPADMGATPADTAAAEEKFRKAHTSGHMLPVKFGKNSLYIPEGTPLTVKLIEDAKEIFLDARANNADVRTRALRKLWKDAHANNTEGKRGYELAKEINLDPATLIDKDDKSLLADAPSALDFNFAEPVALYFKRNNIREGDGVSKLRDDTVITGKVLSSPLILGVDAVDLRWVAQRALEQEKDIDTVIKGLWIMKDVNFQKIWEVHQAQLTALEEQLIKDHGYKEDGTTPKREPTENDRYRIEWQKIVAYQKAYDEKMDFASPAVAKEKPNMFQGITGPDHDKFGEAFFTIEIPNEKVAFESLFTPKWNNYYAIYFTLTGLHGLHVIGGALVLGYYLFFSKGLYLRNPDWLANRVEIGGLFWHFVDLVWIFLFPILYLM